MNRQLVNIWLVGLLISILITTILSCQTGVGPSNPYDPETPADKQASASMTGTIKGIDSATGGETFLEGATIRYYSAAEPLGKSTTTDEYGAFEFAEIKPGRISIEIGHAQHIRQFREITLEPGEERIFDITLDPLPDVTTETVGQITGIAHKSGELNLDPELQDHSGIIVEVEDSGVRTVTNARGEFDLFLNVGTYNLIFSARHYNITRRNDVEVLAGQTITVPDSPVVLDPNPGYVAGTVTLEGMGDNQHGEILLSLLGGQTGTTAADGTYRLTDVAAGTYTMTASKDGYDTQTITGIVVQGGRETVIPAFSLSISRGAISGNVQLSGQSDHGGTNIELTGTVFTAQTNSQGDYAIDGIPVGIYELTASHDGFARGIVGSVQVDANSTTVVEELTLAVRQGDFDINGGAPYTNDPNATLSLTATDAVQMRISELSDFSDTTYVAFEPSPGFTLSDGDGLKTVYVQYLAADSTPSQIFSSSITLDTLPPENAGLTIDGGSLYSNDPGGIVTLRFSASDQTSGVEKLKVSNDGVFDSEPWQDYIDAKTHTLDDPLNDGLRTVYVLYKDFANNETITPVQASITLDRILPTLDSFTIDCNGILDADQCNSLVVELSIGSTDATRMAITNDSGFAVEIFEPITTTRAWYLPSGDGEKFVWIKLMDEAGNKTEKSFDSIILDTAAPSSPTLILAGGANYVASNIDVAVSLTSADSDISQMRIATDGTLDDEPWQSYAMTFNVDLPNDNGENSVYAQVIDLAGNTSPIVEARVTVDTTAPQLFNISIGDGSGWVTTNDGSTQVNISCSDNIVLESEMNLRIEDESANILYNSTYADVVPIVLGSDQITKTITATCSDPVGNSISSAGITVSVDHTPPTINSFTINGGSVDEPLNSHSITVHLLDISDNFSGVLATALSENTFDCASANYAYPGSGDIGYTFSAGEGQRTIYLCAIDTAGNKTTSPVQADNTVMLDTLAPQMPTLTLAGGATYVGSHLNVNVSLVSSDAEYMRFSTDGTLDSESWTTYNPASSIDLPAGDGPKTVLAQVLDAGNNQSPIAEALITIDGSDPQITSISVGQDSGWVTTNDGSTQVNINCQDAIASNAELDLVIVDEGSNTLYSGDYLDVVPIVLGSAEVAKTVTATCLDPVGNSVTSAAIAVSIDHTPPSINSFTINGGAADEPTNDPSITLHLIDIDDNFAGVSATAVAETSFDCATANYSYPVSGDVGFTLSAGEGQRRVYLCATDAAGNTTLAAVASDNTVFLDTIVPNMPALALSGGATYVASHLNVNVSLASSDAEYMRFSTDGSLDNESWITYNPTTTIDLPSGDGQKTVLAQVLDAGNNQSPAAEATITVDGSDPQITSISVGNGSSWVTSNDGSTQVNINCQDSIASATELNLQIVDESANTLYSGDYLDVVPITLGASEVAKTVTATCSDPIGNSVSSAAIPVSIDHTPPSISSYTINGGAADEPTNDPSITLHLVDISDNFSGVSATAVAETSFDCATATYSYPTSGDVGYTLSAGEGQRRVYMCATDAAGNKTLAAIASDNTVFLDTIVPDTPSLTLAAGASYIASNLNVNVSLVSSDAEYMRFATDGTLDNESWITYNASSTINLPAGDGLKTVLAQVLDAGENLSPIAQAQITVDGGAPQMTSISVGDGSGWVTTSDGSTQVAINCSDAIVPDSEISLLIVDEDTNTLYSGDYLDVVPIILGSTEEAKTVTATCSDPVGNSVSSAAIAVSVDHTPPSINSYTLNGGSANEPTNSPAVTLHLDDISDNFSGVMGTALAETSFDCTTATYSYPVSGDVGFTLSSSDGQRYVYMCAKDEAGNVTSSAVASDNAIDLDTQNPQAPGITLAGGTNITRLTGVALTITPPEAGLTLELSGSIDEVGTYSADSPPATVTLNGDDGQLTVSALVIDAAGNQSNSASDWITLDTEAPYSYSVMIDENEPFCTESDGEVTLTLSASDATSVVNRMQLSVDGTCDSEPIIDYAQSATFYLDNPGIEEFKHVYVCFIDRAGNVSEPAHDAITLDYTPPDINNFTLNNEEVNEPTNSREIVVRVDVSDGVSGYPEVALSDSSFSCSDAQYTYHPFQNHPYTLSEGDGIRYMYLCAQDAAGNYTASAIASTNAVNLDTTAPETPTIQVADCTGDGFAISQDQIELRWNPTADTSNYQVHRRVNGADSYTVFDVGTEQFIDDISATVGNTHLYRIRAYDSFGNYSSWSSVIDATPFDPIDGVYWIRSTDILKYTFTPNDGTFWLQATYWWSNVLYSSFYEVLGNNILIWERQEPVERQVNERIVFRTANQDNSLVYDTAVALDINQNRTLDTSGIPGSHNSIVVDSNNKVHISYFDDYANDLRYATNKSGNWQTYTIDSVNDTGTYTSIALDSKENIHISYHYNTSNNLRYATNESGSWVYTDIDTDTNVGEQTSIAVDSKDFIHISYHDVTNTSLKYATNSSGSWSTSTIVSGSNSYGRYSSLVLDSDDNVYIAHLDSTDFDVELATNESGSWTNSTISGTVVGSAHISLAIDLDDNLHLIWALAAGHMWYGTNTGGSWAFEAFAGTGSAFGGLTRSIVTDAKNKVHICYRDSDFTELRYATNLSGAWESITVDNSGNIGVHCSIAMDNLGIVHISHYDVTDGQLRYSNVFTYPWKTDRPDTSGNKTYYPDVAVDSNGRSHLSYMDTINSDLIYATNQDGSWQTTAIDSTGNVGNFSSIAVDSNDFIHISYYDQTNTALKYITNASGSWKDYTLDSTDTTGRLTSLGIDSKDFIHIAYLDYTNAQLKYITNASGSWVDTSIYSSGTATRAGISLDIDNSDNIHIAHYYNHNLYYSTNSSGSWVTTAVDTPVLPAYTGIDPALAVDSNGFVHISYQNGKDMYYITNASGSLVKTEIEVAGISGDDSDIAIDENDKVHIIYSNTDLEDLHYATNTAGYWRVSSIDVTGSVGTNCAVTIDHLGRIHTVYNNADESTIVYSYGRFEGFIPAAFDQLTSPF
jgi:hypothetical protein